MAAAIVAAAVPGAQTPGGTPFRIEKLDPALDEIIRPGELETLGDRFALTEGPVWVPTREGTTTATCCSATTPRNVIYKWAAQQAAVGVPREQRLHRHRQVQGRRADVAGRVAILLIGSNGLALDPQGRLVVTAMADRTVYRLEKDGTRTVLADRYEGKRFNGPNDIVVKSNGPVYFTDTVWGLRARTRIRRGSFPSAGST